MISKGTKCLKDTLFVTAMTSVSLDMWGTLPAVIVMIVIQFVKPIKGRELVNKRGLKPKVSAEATVESAASCIL